MSEQASQPLELHSPGERSSVSSNPYANYGNPNSAGQFIPPPPYQPLQYPPALPPPYQLPQSPLPLPPQLPTQPQPPQPPPQFVQFPASPSSGSPHSLPPPLPTIIMQPGVLVGGRVLIPPPRYVPPILPTDPSLTGVISEPDMLFSNDSRLFRSSPELTKQQLHNFCIAHSEVPEMVIHIEGYHERRTTRRNANGSVTTTVTRITDWEFSCNPTPWIAGPGQQLGVEEAVSRFVDSESTLKTFTITKVVKWDLPQFSQLVRTLAREKGYNNNVAVTMRFEGRGEKCVIEASNDFNDCVNSTGCKILCCLTCLWIFWMPIRYCSTDRFHVRDEYVMTLSPSEFLGSIQHLVPTFHRSGCQIM